MSSVYCNKYLFRKSTVLLYFVRLCIIVQPSAERQCCLSIVPVAKKAIAMLYLMVVHLKFVPAGSRPQERYD